MLINITNTFLSISAVEIVPLLRFNLVPSVSSTQQVAHLQRAGSTTRTLCDARGRGLLIEIRADCPRALWVGVLEGGVAS